MPSTGQKPPLYTKAWRMLSLCTPSSGQELSVLRNGSTYHQKRRNLIKRDSPGTFPTPQNTTLTPPPWPASTLDFVFVARISRFMPLISCSMLRICSCEHFTQSQAIVETNRLIRTRRATFWWWNTTTARVNRRPKYLRRADDIHTLWEHATNNLIRVQKLCVWLPVIVFWILNY